MKNWYLKQFQNGEGQQDMNEVHALPFFKNLLLGELNERGQQTLMRHPY